ncbi:MAG: hypothetical protein NVSMB68_03660 [Thermoanaerobaculia bacterium]
MGQSKTDLFLDRVVAAADPVFEQVIAVERHGAPALSIRTIFEDPHDVHAPLFGVARALIDATAPCFILAVDLPLIRADVLSFLRSRFENSEASMLVPVWNGTPQVLCGGYRTSVAPLIGERMERGHYDLQGLIDDAGGEIISEAEMRSRFEGEPLMNVNTPAELAAAERMR